MLRNHRYILLHHICVSGQSTVNFAKIKYGWDINVSHDLCVTDWTIKTIYYK